MKYVLSIIGFILLAHRIFAQEMPVDTVSVLTYSFEELLNLKVKVSSTKAIGIFDTPSLVSVIHKSEFDEYNFSTVAEALNYVAGVEVLQTVIDKNVTTIRGILQNFYANKILLLIDNTPTWQPIYGNGQIERIGINDIERIEVLKGPASVLYGSNAYCGVVNIILKHSAKTNSNFLLKQGTPTVYSASGNMTYVNNNLNLFVSAHSATRKGNPYLFTGANGVLYNNDSLYYYNDQHYENSMNLRLEYKAHSVTVNRFSYDHSFYGIHPSFSGGASGLVKNHGLLAFYRFDKKLNEKANVYFNLAYDYFKRDFPVNADGSNQILISGDRVEATTKLNYSFTQDFKMELGLNIENRHSHGHKTFYALTDSLIVNNMPGSDNLHELALFSQLNYLYHKFELLIGGRYTYNQNFGNDLSGRFSIQYKFNRHNVLKFIVGQSFRVPTLFELYFNHPTVLGNPDLNPEKALSGEMAYQSHFKNFYVQGSIYLSEYKNLIQRVERTNGLQPVYENQSEIDGIGFELELKYKNKELFDGFLNYTFQDAFDTHSQENFIYVPSHMVSYGISKRIKTWNSSLTGLFYSKCEGFARPVEPQFTLNYNLGYSFDFLTSGHIVFIGSIKNINNSYLYQSQYIRPVSNVNQLPSNLFGREFIATIRIEI